MRHPAAWSLVCVTLTLPVLVACGAMAQPQAVPASTVKVAAPTMAPAPAGSYRAAIAPMFKQKCAECHGAESPTLAEFKLNEDFYKKEKLGPRTDTYENLLQIIAYTDTGALQRRLDDGSNTADKKPGNMFKYLGETDAERLANLAVIKAWVGEGAWNLNRWAKRGDVPGITKDQLDKLKLTY
jgi:mono/diheme cytochrome c family protein